ncbi:MAG: hypothetical protein WD716_07705 [Fimbriimonadaceae bacterium]
MIAALLLLAQQPQTVTFTHPAAHASVVLEALGRQLGVTLRPSGSVTQDWFAARFTDQPASEAMRLIAECLNAEWVAKDGVTYLTRGTKQHNEEKREEEASIRQAIRKFIASNTPTEFDRAKAKEAVIVLSRERATRPNSFSTASYGLVRAFSPEERVGGEIVRALGENTLLALDIGETKRFVRHPDGKTDMPPTLLAAINKYLAEKQNFAEIVQSVGAEDIVQMFTAMPVGAPQTTFVELSRLRGRVQVSLRESSGTPQSGVSTSTRTIANFSRARPSSRFSAWPRLTGMLELDATAWSFLRMVRASDNPGQAAKPEDALVVKVLAKDLSRNEPLTIYGSAPLLAMGEQSKRDYVALVGDDAFTGNWLTVAENDNSLEAAWQRWIGNYWCAEDAKTKVVLVRPYFPADVRDYRIDRAAVSRLVTQQAAKGHLTLDMLADLAVRTGDGARFSNHAKIAAAVLRANANTFGDWVALRTFGALNLTQRRMARDGGFVVEWRALPQPVRAEIERMLAYDALGFSAEHSPRVNWTATQRVFYGQTFQGNMVPPVSLSSGTARIAVYTNTMLLPSPPTSGNATNSVLSTDQVAGAMLTRSSDNKFWPDYNRLAVVGVERLQLELFVPSVGYSTFASQVDTSSDSTQYVAVDKLPQEWQRAINESKRRLGG